MPITEAIMAPRTGRGRPKMPGPRKKRIPVPGSGGQEFVEGTVMQFQTVLENFNEYLVDDGTVVHIKLVATEVVKLHDTYDEQGNPVYVIGSQNVTTISVPDQLRKQD